MERLTQGKGAPGRLVELNPQEGQRALLVGTFQGSEKRGECSEALEELARLSETYGLFPAIRLEVPLRGIDSSTFIGKGKVEEIRRLVEEGHIEVVIFDEEISPHQQRNLEEGLACSVIDRTELILGVFAQRAETKEAKIQIDLATFRYQLPRLKRLWTHLSRQRTGGAGGGFLKGEGEKQIEIDRRILRRQIDRLQGELKEVKGHRKTQKRWRERSGIPTFAIIGYTNAGKSTLLKALTQADVLIEDKLFATLDPTTRKFLLPNHQPILLTDTVGFIRKIPHQLVAAFRSTLEEAVEADILLHLIDASHPSALLQAEATLQVLKELQTEHRPIITVLNKVDRCQERLLIQKLKILYPKTVEISAVTGAGLDQLLERMEQQVALLRRKVHLRIPQSEYALVSEVIRQGRVYSSTYEENDVLLEAEIPLSLEGKLAPYRMG